MDWVDGKWARPPKKKLEEMIFRPGSAVEVNLKNEVGTDAAWIPAKVLEETGNNSYMIEYRSSRKGVAGEHQQMTVDIQRIRPVPPTLEKKYIGLLDKVEAFFDFGWRNGVITKLRPNQRYNVFFKDRALDKELSHSELRIPLAWKDGRWFTVKDVMSMFPDGQQKQESKGLQNSQESEMSAQPIKKLKECHGEVLPKCQPKEKLHGSAYPTTTPCYGYISSKESGADDLPSSNAERPLQECEKELIVDQEHGQKLPLKRKGRPRKSLLKCIHESGTDKKNNRNGADVAVEHSKSTGAETDKKNNRNGASAADMAVEHSTSIDAETDEKKNKNGGSGDDMAVEHSKSTGAEAEKNNRNESSTADMAVEHSKSTGAETEKKNNTNGGSGFVMVVEHSKPTGAETDKKKNKNDGSGADMAVEHSKSTGVEAEKKNNKNDSSTADMAVEHSKSTDAETEKMNSANGGSRVVMVLEHSKPTGSETDMKNNRNGGGGGADIAVEHLKSTGAETDKKSKGSAGSAADTVLKNLKSNGAKRGKRGSAAVKDCAGKEVVMKTDDMLASSRLTSWRSDASLNPRLCVRRRSHRLKLPQRHQCKETIDVEIYSELSNPNDEKNIGNSGGDVYVAVEHSKSDGANMGEILDKRGRVDGDAVVSIDSASLPSNSDKNGGDPHAVADYGGIHSPPVPGLASQSTVCQGNEAGGSDEEPETPLISATFHSTQVQDENSCFAKKSPFWKQFEAMDLFKKMPQNPHFSPLKDCKEAFREGRAVGYMMGFIDLAEQTSGLTIDDSRSTFDNLLENLRELEEVGFDVKALQDQANKLLTVKLRKTDLLNQTREIQRLLAEHERKKAECEEKEEDLEKALKEFQEKYASVVAEKKSEEFEITVLRSRKADMNKIINHLGVEFDSVSC